MSDSGLPYGTLLEAHQKRIYYFIRTMVYNPDDAHDVLQNVNMILLKKEHQFNPSASFRAWAFACARFECLSYLRKGGKEIPLDEHEITHFTEKVEEMSEHIDQQVAALSECMKSLNDQSRQLIAYRYGQQKISLEQVATRYKTSVGALKQKLFRTREKLKKCVSFRLKNSF